MKKIIISYCFLLFCIVACQNGNVPENDNSSGYVKDDKLIEFVSPFNNIVFKLGDKIDFVLKKLQDSVVIDSIRFFIGNVYVTTLKSENLTYSWNSINSKLGKINIQAVAYSKTYNYSISMVVQLLSDNKPVEYGYKIIKVYPHSRTSYTQGLFYENGFLYESVGEYGKSALMKTRLETGEVVMSYNLESNYFAEGLAQYNDQLYQLTYHENTCFIYDKKTFELKGKLSYNYIEGWGLEFDGKNFLLTDGSYNIYIVEPQYFTQIDKIEVCNDKELVDSINELEIINNKLYANLYLKNSVVIINMKNGKVEGTIDFTGILPASDYTSSTDVLNGIAWNPANNHLFITGKRWPKLFEVAIFKK